MEENKKIKVSDFIANFVASKGVRFIHFLAGGGAASLNDSFGKHPQLKYISYNSESGASYGAFGESKYTNKLSVLNVTGGIGGISALPGVISAWNDSIPMLIISGNVNFNQTARYYKLHKNLNLRQVGIQDNDIIEVVRNITKYAITLEKPEDILYELEKCCYLATNGRPSPVWLEIPANVANALIDIKNLKEFNIMNFENRPKDVREHYNQILSEQNEINDTVQKLKKDIENSKRPLVLAGGGIRQSNSIYQFRKFIEKYQIPFVNTFLGCDLMDYDSRFRLGTIGVKPNRNANFSIQNCDLLIVLGCQLNICHIGYIPDKFAPKARKVAVDIDKEVHKKELVKLDEIINCDLQYFFAYINE